MDKATKIFGLIGIIVGVIAIAVLLIMGYKPCKLTIFGAEFPLKCETVDEIPTTMPTPCPPELTCYEDNFSELNPARWCKAPSEGIEFRDNHLFVSAPAGLSHEIHPCEYLDSNLRFVELAFRMIQSDGYAGNAHIGLGASLNNDSYIEFLLDSAGNIVLTHGLGGQSSAVDEKISTSDLSIPHVLRVEWTGDKVLFSADGTQLTTQMDAKTYGNWFYIIINSWENANITARLDSVRWGVASP